MNSDEHLEQLQRVSSEFSAYPSVVDDVMQRIEEMPTPARRISSRNKMIALAASLALCLAVSAIVGKMFLYKHSEQTAADLEPPTTPRQQPQSNVPAERTTSPEQDDRVWEFEGRWEKKCWEEEHWIDFARMPPGFAYIPPQSAKSAGDSSYIWESVLASGGLWNNHYTFDGMIDEVTVHCRPLSAEEIRTLFESEGIITTDGTASR